MAFPKFKTKDEIPKGFEDSYEEVNDEWVFKTDDDDLKTALEKERKRADAAEKLTTKTAKELKTLQTAAAAANAGMTDDQLKELREQVRKDLEGEFAPFKSQAETLGAENRMLLLDNQMKGLYGKAKFLPERHEELWKLTGSDFDLTEDKKPMVKGKPGLTPEKYITDVLAKKYPEWVQGTQAGGGGAGGSTTVPGVTGTTSVEDMLKKPGAARAAIEQARAAGQTQ